MELTRSTRVSIMLFFSTLLFFLELIVGYIAGSIALVADSFHMLNDVLSLVIALYAIKFAKNNSVEPSNTYGWQRSEILGALMNAVLLIGLCLTIYIESIQRFFIIIEIEKPQLVLIVGTIGLVFNIVGMYLFGEEHGHSHGHSHSHSEAHDHDHNHAHSQSHGEAHIHHGKHEENDHLIDFKIQNNLSSQELENSYGSVSEASNSNEGRISQGKGVFSSNGYRKIEASPPDNILVSTNSMRPTNDYPAVTHNAILESAELIKKISSNKNPNIAIDTHLPDSHGTHNHSSQNLNMRGVWLHVFGDCLANVAVISSALFIMLTDYSWKHYADPVISIIINTLIVAFTIPLIKSASFILLQGVPPAINVAELYSKLKKIPHVFNVHELHVWQLSDSKIVASVHLQIVKDTSKPDSSQIGEFSNTKCPNIKSLDDGSQINTDLSSLFMKIGAIANFIFHSYGIHSTTIQPEFISSDYFNSGNLISSSPTLSKGLAQESLDSIKLNAVSSDIVDLTSPNSNSAVSSPIKVYKNILSTDVNNQFSPEPPLTIESQAIIINDPKESCLLRCQDGECADMECCK
ncbi:Zinc/cadmium resistance protein [Smittium culicis]|uniref:Zinc/cadmium resistance protein n=1 Tax=Smittium culicis TaxID=133412 RepID=A0A1R1X5G6_9FUNG|nr:Zinc/cadmium resistance protein [Smittium culicis]